MLGWVLPAGSFVSMRSEKNARRARNLVKSAEHPCDLPDREDRMWPGPHRPCDDDLREGHTHERGGKSPR